MRGYALFVTIVIIFLPGLSNAITKDGLIKNFVSQQAPLLPKDVSSEVRILSLSLDTDMRIKYKYVLKQLDVVRDNISKKDIDDFMSTQCQSTRNGVCSTPNMSLVLDAAMSIDYTYVDRNNYYVGLCRVDAAMCGFRRR
jgi:hypothetical protein